MPQGEMMSKYISRAEFQCRCCGKLPPDCVKGDDGDYPTFYDALFYRFDNLREAWGKPIVVTSGYRCPTHEYEVSGSRLGPHIWGALAPALTEQDKPRFVALVETTHPEMRMGTNVHPGAVHIHLDCLWLAVPRYTEFQKEGVRWTE